MLLWVPNWIGWLLLRTKSRKNWAILTRNIDSLLWWCRGVVTTSIDRARGWIASLLSMWLGRMTTLNRFWGCWVRRSMWRGSIGMMGMEMRLWGLWPTRSRIDPFMRLRRWMRWSTPRMWGWCLGRVGRVQATLGMPSSTSRVTWPLKSFRSPSRKKGMLRMVMEGIGSGGLQVWGG